MTTMTAILKTSADAQPNPVRKNASAAVGGRPRFGCCTGNTSHSPSTRGTRILAESGLLEQRLSAGIARVLQPRDVARLREALDAHLLDRRVRHDLERRKARVMAVLVGVIGSRVIAADHRPARIVAPVLIGAVQK